MKILILTMIFLSIGAWLVQEQDPHIAQETKVSPSFPQKISQVASDIPKPSFTKGLSFPVPVEEVTIHRFEPVWELEMYAILLSYDPVHGEEIFSNYVEERARHEEKVNESLTMSFDMLSDLNGQSGYGKQELEVEVVDLEREHSARVKNILGDHFEYLDEQHQQFREPSESADTGDL